MTMKDFVRCQNGHFYKKDLGDCPHCSGGNGNVGSSDFDKTQVFGGASGSGSNDATVNFGAGGEDKTQVFGSGVGSASGSKPARDFDKTFIGVPETSSSADSGGNEASKEKPRPTRKITGWLVSFTLDPMGVDYRIFEGSNTIGRDNNNSIIIKSDATISGTHATILFRAEKFYIEDKMTSNGTKVNGEMLEPTRAYVIQDGDKIHLGDTLFIFKTWN